MHLFLFLVAALHYCNYQLHAADYIVETWQEKNNRITETPCKNIDYPVPAGKYHIENNSGQLLEVDIHLRHETIDIFHN